MLFTQLEKYEVERVIEDSDSILLFVGGLRGSEKKVLLKTNRPTKASTRVIGKLVNEFNITSSLDIPGILKPIDNVKYQDGYALVFDYTGEITLKDSIREHSLPLAKSIALASQLAQSLGEMHSRGIVHKNIKPSNILWNRLTDSTQLMDFGIATKANIKLTHMGNPSRLEGTLAYMSPEQTGRMNRIVDFRSDLYSFGITLYELFSGKLPFDSQDPLELVHSHLARTPKPLHVIDTRLPEELSGIVSKLLSKHAEDRYQNAFRLKEDLVAFLEGIAKGNSVFSPSSATQATPLLKTTTRVTSGEFRIHQKLYGREKEKEKLQSIFAQTAEGTKELVLISGFSGVGKSALVNEMYAPIAERKAMFVSGKFDQLHRSLPYSAIKSAFDDFAKLLLTEESESLEKWRLRIQNSLGNLGQVLVDLVPSMEYIIGKQAPVPDLPPQESFNRLQLVFQRLVQSISTEEHPFILFIDDLQWVDNASLELLRGIFRYPGLKYFLFIGAFRDDEVDKSHRLSRHINEVQSDGLSITSIQLAGLTPNDLSQLIGDALQTDTKSIATLSEVVLKKSTGNPLFATELLKTLYQEGLLIFEKERWIWDVERIQTKRVPDNVADLMVRKLYRLPQESQHTLKLAACIGNRFNLRTLAIIYERDVTETLTHIWNAVEEGLILTLDKNSTIPMHYDEYNEFEGYGFDLNMRFAHDRVQQSCYDLIRGDHKGEIHLQIARLLNRSLQEQQRKERIFDIVDQFNLGYSMGLLPEEHELVAGLNLDAAQLSRQSAAYASAETYTRHGLACLGSNSWNTHYSLCFELNLLRAECLYLLRNFNDSQLLFDQLLPHSKTKIDHARVLEILLVQSTQQGDLPKAISTGITCLKLFDLNIPYHPSRLRLFLGGILPIRLHRIFLSVFLRKKSIVEAAPMIDREKKFALRIIAQMFAPAFGTDQSLFAYLVCQSVKLSLKHGPTSDSAYSYALLGAIVGPALGRFSDGEEYADIARKLSDLYPDRRTLPRIKFALGVFLYHWTLHGNSSLSPIRDAIQLSQENGDLTYSAFSAAMLGDALVALGTPLDESEQELDHLIRYVKGLQAIRFMLPLLQSLKQYVRLLRGLTVNVHSFDDESFDEIEFEKSSLKNDSLNWYWTSKLRAYYLVEEFEKAVSAGEKGEDLIHYSFSMPISREQTYYYCLALIAAHRQRPNNQYLQIARRKMKTLRIWARFGQENSQHKYLLVKAELADLKGKRGEARDLYEKAIDSAKNSQYRQQEALAYELAGKHFSRCNQGRVASAYLREARSLYLDWGATAKVKLLERIYPLSIPKDERPSKNVRTSDDSTDFSSTGSLDLATLIKSYQIISSEIKLQKLVQKIMHNIMQNAGAQRGFLILKKDNSFTVEAEANVSLNSVVALQGTDLSTVHSISKAIVNYVARTKESVVINDAQKESRFANDPYIRESKPLSVLSTPIVYQGKLLGVVYLENNLIMGAFTKDRIETLKLLASQVAISLENSLLYENLEQKIEERNRELHSSRREIDEIMGNVQQGLLIIFGNGQIGPGYSEKAKDMLGRPDLSGLHFPSLFDTNGLSEKVTEYLHLLFNNGFMGDALFERTNPLKEVSYPILNSSGVEETRILSFHFSRIFSESQAKVKRVQKVMVVIDDMTEEFGLKKELDKKNKEQAERVEILYQILHLKPHVFRSFVKESKGIVASLLLLVERNRQTSAEWIDAVEKGYRQIHTLKGNARALNLTQISTTAHFLESSLSDLIRALRKEEGRDLDRLKAELIKRIHSLRIEISSGQALFEKILGMQSALSSEEETSVDFEAHVSRVIEKECSEFQKSVRFEFNKGDGIASSDFIFHDLVNPLLHLIRNAIGHGIESQTERQRKGKSSIGKISLNIEKGLGAQGESIFIIRFEDDGAGIPFDLIRQKAFDLQLIDMQKSEEMTTAEIGQFIFFPGLTTATTVNELIGRGIGMDAVRSEIEALNGTISVESLQDQYTRYMIKIPSRNS